MIKISEYMTRTKEERTAHLNLDEQCSEIGGTGSNQYKGLLAYFLGTMIPTGEKVHLCHMCGNPKCSNVRHLYWGTPKENHEDSKTHGRWKSIHERTLLKHGKEKMSEMAKSNGSKSGVTQRMRALEKWEQHRYVFEEEIGKRGWPKRVSERLGINPDHARKISKLLGVGDRGGPIVPV